MNNPLQPRAALALAVAQGEDLASVFFRTLWPDSYRNGEGRSEGLLWR
jgi:hypothetical protein